MRINRTALGLFASLSLSACGSDSITMMMEPPPPTLSALSVERMDPAMTMVAAGTDLALVAKAQYSDGTSVDVSANAEWTSSDIAIATVAKGHLHSLTQGAVMISAKLEDKTATFSVTIGAPVATSLVLYADTIDVERGATAELTAVGGFTDGTERDVTAEATWTSSDETIATVQAGVVTGVHAGQATITGELGGQMVIATANVTCTYPSTPNDISLFGYMPRLSWMAAYKPDGTTAPLDLQDVYCGAGDFANVKTIGVVVSAGWCPHCPPYIQAVQAQTAEAEANGMMILYAIVQDTNYRPSDSRYAHSDVSHIIPGGGGWRVGDTDDSKRLFFNSSAYITAFPSAFALRTRDMKMIADRDSFNSVIPFAQIAAHPEEDWTMGTPFINKCGPSDEEAGEPNDSYDYATDLRAGGQHGGICNQEADFYSITTPGNWRVSVTFQSSVGDIDVYVWDRATNQPKLNNGSPIGSYGTSDTETFTYQGPAVIKVVGYQNASGPYDITLEELP